MKKQPAHRKGSQEKSRRTPDRKGTQQRKSTKLPVKKTEDESIRLNKYIAASGICSRREADQLIQAGLVSVNGKKIGRAHV